MSGNCFESICSDIKFTTPHPPTFILRYIFAWNGHIQKLFIPYWISCLNESMSVWMNKFKFPGFVFCPHKPYSKGKSYHIICCGENGIIYYCYIVEGRDYLIPMGRPEFETSPNMKMVGIIIWLMISLWSTDKTVIMDSKFCVLKRILGIRKRGVYGSVLIKKRRYWPTGVHGDGIND